MNTGNVYRFFFEVVIFLDLFCQCFHFHTQILKAPQCEAHKQRDVSVAAQKGWTFCL